MSRMQNNAIKWILFTRRYVGPVFADDVTLIPEENNGELCQVQPNANAEDNEFKVYKL